MAGKKRNERIFFQKGELLESTVVNNRVKLLKLRPSEPFEWIPGQFIITKTEFDGKDKIADYTIISSATITSELEIIVDNYPGSEVGKLLHSLQVGDSITFKAPRGRFSFEPENERDIVFVFRDIGIAAALPLLLQLYEQEEKRKIHIFNIVSKEFGEIMRDRIDQYGEVLDIDYNMVDNSEIDEKRLQNGKIMKKDMMHVFGDIIDCNLYISGASEFVKSIRQKFISIGVDKEKIVREVFG